MQYTISYTSPNTHFLDIILSLKDVTEEEIFLQLPSWRPGRYELANFAKNIQHFKVFNNRGEAVPFKKVSKDRWQLKATNSSGITIHYNYYAFQMDAGNSWLDENQVYVNFINCLVYDERRIHEKCQVTLKIPEDYEIACGLPQTKKNTLEAIDYYRLVDSPMIASNNLKHLIYKTDNHTFHIWIMGLVQIDEKRILKDFLAFTQKQQETMNGFPHPDYHFLFQVLPYKHYHGVEHFNSTVITIGPSEKFNKTEFYNNVLGVSSHELFHTWNAIRIRPHELMPYDFSKENYFKTGFIAEGLTTYYGDLFLVRSKVYDKKTYFSELNAIIFKHFDNNGRKNRSLIGSSFDLWLDGYVSGIPNRKVSIYIKGAVVALMLDLDLRSGSLNTISLDDVVRHLWEEFGKKNIGYTLEHVKTAIENVSERNFDEFFEDYIYGTAQEENRLNELLKCVGCTLKPVEIINEYERDFGFKISIADGTSKISAIEPGSIAEEQLSLEDELIAVNNRKIENNLTDLVAAQKEIELLIFRNNMLKKINLTNKGEKYWMNYSIAQNPSATLEEKENFQKWLGCEW